MVLVHGSRSWFSFMVLVHGSRSWFSFKVLVYGSRRGATICAREHKRAVRAAIDCRAASRCSPCCCCCCCAIAACTTTPDRSFCSLHSHALQLFFSLAFLCAFPFWVLRIASLGYWVSFPRVKEAQSGRLLGLRSWQAIVWVHFGSRGFRFGHHHAVLTMIGQCILGYF
jgi:hypothetical protein